MDLRSHTYVLFLAGICCASLCLAARADDEEDDRVSAYDFAEKFAGEDKAVLNAALEELKGQEKKFKAKASPEQVREIDNDLARLKGEADFLNAARAQFTSRTRVETALKNFDPSQLNTDESLRITSKKRTVAEARQAQERIEAELKKSPENAFESYQKNELSGEKLKAFEKLHKAEIAELDAIREEIKAAPERVMVLPSTDAKSPFQLVASTKRNLNTNITTLSVRVQLKPDGQALMASDPKLKRLLAKVGYDDLKSSIDSNLGLKDIDLGKDEAKITTNLQSPRTATTIMETIKDKVAARLEEIGSKGDSTSAIGVKEEERARLTDTKKKAEALLNVQLQRKIAEWLKQNKGVDMAPCQIISKVMDDNKNGQLDEGEWAKIPQDSRQKCAELDPKKKREQAAAESSKFDEDNQRRASAAAAARAYEQVAAQCEAAKQQQAMVVAATEQVTGPIQKLKDGLDRAGLSSELFARLISNDDGNIDLDNPTDTDLDPLVTKAAGVVQTVTKDKSGNDRLLKEREAVSNLVKRGWLALERSGSLSQMVQPNQNGEPVGPYGQILDPAKINMATQQVQRMAYLFNASKTLLNAIDAEIGARDAANKAKFGGGGGGGGGVAPGTVQVNTAPTAADPRDGANGGGRTADRMRIQNNQRAKGSRPAGNGPNYLNR